MRRQLRRAATTTSTSWDCWKPDPSRRVAQGCRSRGPGGRATWPRFAGPTVQVCSVAEKADAEAEVPLSMQQSRAAANAKPQSDLPGEECGRLGNGQVINVYQVSFADHAVDAEA